MNHDNILLPGERIDDLGRNQLRIIQNPEYFCFGIDAVILSSFIKAHPGETVLDLCTGNGIIPILLSAKTKAKEIMGLEIQHLLWDEANRSVKLNHIEKKIKIFEGDIKEAPHIFKNKKINVISVNPPYMKYQEGIVNQKEELTIARHEKMCTFEDIAKVSSRMLVQKGRLYLVHRPLRLVEILNTLSKYGLEPKRLRLVQSYKDKEPKLVLIEAIKGASAELRIAPNLVIYSEKDVYTKEVMEIYGYDQ